MISQLPTAAPQTIAAIDTPASAVARLSSGIARTPPLRARRQADRQSGERDRAPGAELDEDRQATPAEGGLDAGQRREQEPPEHERRRRWPQRRRRAPARVRHVRRPDRSFPLPPPREGPAAAHTSAPGAARRSCAAAGASDVAHSSVCPPQGSGPAGTRARSERTTLTANTTTDSAITAAPAVARSLSSCQLPPRRVGVDAPAHSLPAEDQHREEREVGARAPSSRSAAGRAARRAAPR